MERHGVRRFASQSCMAITKWTASRNNSLCSLPQFHHHHIADYQSFSRFLEACKLSLDMKAAAETHARVIRFGYGTHPSLAALLISAYVKFDRFNLACHVVNQIFSWTDSLVALNLIVDNLMRFGEYAIAKKVFNKMPERDVVTWNSMIAGYVKNARFEEALGFFRAMLNSSVEPDKFAFASVMTACAKLGALSNAQWVHDLMVQQRIELNSILCSALIGMYSKCGRIDTAKKIFGRVRVCDVSVWNAMINGLALHGRALDAISVFLKMELKNVVPDCITFLGVLTACSHCGLVEEGRKYFDLMRGHYSIQPQLEHYGAMVDLLSRAGLLEDAYAMIEGMPMEPDVVIWRALLSACRKYKNPELGEVAVRNMPRLRSGDYVLLSNIYCSQGRWESAQGVREMMKMKGVRKMQGKSWFELEGVVRQFKAGDLSHPETASIYKILNGLILRTKTEGFMPTTGLVAIDVSEEEKEVNLNYHSEKLALAFGILKTGPGTEIRISKNLRICDDCHSWIKMVSGLLSRVIIVRDRIRFHQFKDGSCSCGDYW